MTELEEKISRLAAVQVPSPDGIVLRPFGGRNLLGALLVEIDESVMGRTLSVTNDAGGELLLDVVNRRLVNVRKRTDRTVDGSQENLIAPPDDPKDPEYLSALHDLFTGFIGKSQSLKVGIGEIQGSQPADAFGLAASNLGSAWGVALRPDGNSVGVSDAFEPILVEFRSAIVTWVRHHDGQTDCGGDGAYYAAIEELSGELENEMAAFQRSVSSVARDRSVTTFDWRAKPGHAIIHGAFEGTSVTLLVREDNRHPLVSRLQESLHGWW